MSIHFFTDPFLSREGDSRSKSDEVVSVLVKGGGPSLDGGGLVKSADPPPCCAWFPSLQAGRTRKSVEVSDYSFFSAAVSGRM